jgi:Xaa-Pro aminopeptidase
MSFPVLSLHSRLRRLGVDALLFNTSETLPSMSVRYLAGFNGSDASLLITSAERHLFTDGRYKIQVERQCQGFRIHVVKRKLDSLASAIKKAGVARLGIEAARVSYDFVTMLERRLPHVEMVPLSRAFLEGLRLCKSPEERDKVKTAAHMASESCREVLQSGIRGRREVDVAADLENRFRQKGAEGLAFETIVASGERSALPHGTATDRIILEGDLVIIDFGCRFEGYHSDETVTCSVGAPSDEQEKIHRAVFEAHERAMDAAKEGVSVRDLDRIARQSINAAGYGRFFIHGLGHGVGLEIHEPPYLSPRGKGRLKEGMIFTIEPGIYVEGVGGVRLESLVYLDAGGPEILCEMPKELIEAF